MIYFGVESQKKNLSMINHFLFETHLSLSLSLNLHAHTHRGVYVFRFISQGSSTNDKMQVF